MKGQSQNYITLFATQHLLNNNDSLLQLSTGHIGSMIKQTKQVISNACHLVIQQLNQI